MANKKNQNSAELMLYLVSKKRILRLSKIIKYQVFPRLNEWIQVHTKDEWSNLQYEVVQITHREKGIPEIWLQSSSLKGNKRIVSFFEDDEMDDYSKAYIKSGWHLRSSSPNTIYRRNGTSIFVNVGKSKNAT